jgi:hypothetical protein
MTPNGLHSRATQLVQRGLCGLAVLGAALALAGLAAAGGGNYVFAGGDRMQRAQVHAARAASRFNWNIVPATITIRIRSGVTSHAVGARSGDSRLLDAGRFSWATIQDEYAHQVDFFLLPPEMRNHLGRVLGARAWCYEDPRCQAHPAQGCGRFSSMLSWAYWPSSEKRLPSDVKTDEAAAIPRSQFRELLTRLLVTEGSHP